MPTAPPTPSLASFSNFCLMAAHFDIIHVYRPVITKAIVGLTP